MTRLILIRHAEESPLISSLTFKDTLAPQQDRVSEKPEIMIPQEPSISTISETLVYQVQPALGTTPRENLQLWQRNRPEDITDILGTTAFEGYIDTPIQTLDSIYVKQPKRFLPLAEEANVWQRRSA